MSHIDAAKLEYKKADASTKEILQKIFGKDAFKSNWKDVKTFEDACQFNGTSPVDVLPYSNPTTAKQEWLNALSMMDEIVTAINPGFVPDYSNSTQKKWTSWFQYEKGSSGFRFDDSYYDYVRTDSTGGSRLCSEDDEKNQYIATQFIDIWNIILLK